VVKYAYMREIYLPDSLEDIQLNLLIAAFERNPEWTEVTGPEKENVDAGSCLSWPERIFKKECGDKTLHCGFVFGRLYKIAISASLAYLNVYLEEFSKQYGKPAQIKDGHYVWESYDKCLQLVEGEELYVFLQDKKLLQKAKGE
jgi:hypothetical protein